MPIISDIKHIHPCRINLMVDIHRRPPPRRRPLRHHRLHLHPQHLHRRIEAMVLNLHPWNLILAWSFLKLPFQLQPHARSHLEIVVTMGWSISSIIMPNWLRALWFASRPTTTKCPDMQRTSEIGFCLFFVFFFCCCLFEGTVREVNRSSVDITISSTFSSYFLFVVLMSVSKLSFSSCIFHRLLERRCALLRAC